MGEREVKYFKVRLSKSLYERFFRAFPAPGERKLVLEYLIGIAIDLAEDSSFAKRVIEEARERWKGGLGDE